MGHSQGDLSQVAIRTEREGGGTSLGVLCSQREVSIIPKMCVCERECSCMCKGEVVKILFLHLGKEFKRNKFTELHRALASCPQCR